MEKNSSKQNRRGEKLFIIHAYEEREEKENQLGTVLVM